MRHELKCWPEPFWATARGEKLYEVRQNDRDYRVGDEVVLRCWEPQAQEYEGPWIEGRITFLTAGPDWGLPEGLCVFTLSEDVFDDGTGVPYPGRHAKAVPA